MNQLTRWLLSKEERNTLEIAPKALKLIEEVKAIVQTGGASYGAPNSSLQILQNALIGQGFISAPTFQDVNAFIQQGFNANTTVYSIITNTSKKFGSIDWYLNKIKPTKEGRKAARQYKAATKGEFITPAGMAQALLLKERAYDEVEDHPMLKLWNNPNKEQSGAEFRESAMAFKMLTGSA